MNTIINILLFLLILGILVFVHELGHFLAAKKSGVFIHEFSIGMGPLVKQITGKDGIKYSIRALPLGGYVQMAGEIYEDDDTKKIPKDKFMCNKKWYQRLIILCAGVFNNFLLAIIILFVIGLAWGATSLKPVIYDVVPNKPMAKAGIVAGDEIISVNGKKTKTWDRVQLLLLLKTKDNEYEIGIKHEDVVVVSPDHGSANRGRDVSSVFNNASLAVIDKRRPAPNKSEVTNVVGDCKDKICLVIDDIVDTCGTINNAVDALFKKGAKEVFVAATHAILSRGKIDPRVKEFVTTDTVEKDIEGATVLSVADLISKAILSE